MYKHNEKLQCNIQEQDDNVILYKEGMTVSDFAKAFGVNGTEVIKKINGFR